MIRLPVALAALLAATAPASAAPLDAHFVADRVLVDLPLRGGGHVRFWSDTGGGTTILYDRTLRRLGLGTEPLTGPLAADVPGARQVAGTVPFAQGAAPIPPAPILAMPDDVAKMGVSADSDGNLGQDWFAGHIWTWDYPRGTLTIERSAWRAPAGARTIPVGFRAAAPGRPGLHFPRIVITIAGQQVPMLLDTGATTVLTPRAVAAIGGGPRLRATSMITARTIARWRRVHPAWRVIERAQGGTGSRMIEVPDVRIAGIEVGPVWFTERPDEKFTDMMSSSMDAPVEGAIGGNAFRSLRMTVDYLHGRASFTKAVQSRNTVSAGEEAASLLPKLGRAE